MSNITDTAVFDLMFSRPKEPIFVGKGEINGVFEVADNFISDRFRPIKNQISNRFGQPDVRVPIKNIKIPDLSIPMEMNRFENFSLFVPKHRTLAGELIKIFIGVRSVEDLKAVAVYARDRINPYLFNYALSVALLHRPDTKGVDVPSFVSSFPDKFVDGIVLERLREEIELVDTGSRNPIVIPRDYTASDLEPEHRLAYFREDLGINLHHWHWHLVYPFEGPDSVVRKDRRGELFYYMHQQIVARYNFERFSNGMTRVERFLNWREPIPEGYFPKLDSLISSRGWPARAANTRLQNINREIDQINFDIDDLERWRDRIYAAIHTGVVQTSTGQRIQLDERTGIDILGNMIEASTLTPHRNFYGDLHNMGHIFISFCHDPDARHLESFGVIGDSSTAMRDPAFYRWHAFIDMMFQDYKATLPGYEIQQLNYPGVFVRSIGVTVQNGPPNVLQTFWQQSDLDLSRGMDFSPRGSVFARFTHLQHLPFSYNISIENQGPQRRGTCRLFLAPKLDGRGRPWLFRDQRMFMIELDRFSVNLRSGMNNVIQRSVDSSLTIPFSRTFRDLDSSRPTDESALAQFNFCGCGWPQHMLLPRGSPEGLPCELFVMISNFADDIIDQAPPSGSCNDSFSFCGLKDRLYPDRRAMGYPFDRMPRQGVDTLQQFLTPNMKVQDVIIRFTDRTVVGNQRITTKRQ